MKIFFPETRICDGITYEANTTHDFPHATQAQLLRWARRGCILLEENILEVANEIEIETPKDIQPEKRLKRGNRTS